MVLSSEISSGVSLFFLKERGNIGSDELNISGIVDELEISGFSVILSGEFGKFDTDGSTNSGFSN